MKLRNCRRKKKKTRKSSFKKHGTQRWWFYKRFYDMLLCFHSFVLDVWADQAMNIEHVAMFSNEYEYLLYNNNFLDWKLLHYFRNANKVASGLWTLHTCSNSIIIIWNNHTTIITDTDANMYVNIWNCTIFEQKGTFCNTKQNKTKIENEKRRKTWNYNVLKIGHSVTNVAWQNRLTNRLYLVQRKNKIIKIHTAVHYNKFERTPLLALPCIYIFSMFNVHLWKWFSCSLFIVLCLAFHLTTSWFTILHTFITFKWFNIQTPNTTISMFIWIFFFSCTDYRAPNENGNQNTKYTWVLLLPFSHILCIFSIHCSGNEHTISSNINKMHKYSKLERCFFAFIGIFSFISLVSFSFSFPFLSLTANYNMFFFSFVRHELRG